MWGGCLTGSLHSSPYLGEDLDPTTTTPAQTHTKFAGPPSKLRGRSSNHSDSTTHMQIEMRICKNEAMYQPQNIQKSSQSEIIGVNWQLQFQRITLLLCTIQGCNTTSGKLTICFSVYLLELSRLTASMCPKSMSWPSRKMKSSLHTYFFLL